MKLLWVMLLIILQVVAGRDRSQFLNTTTAVRRRSLDSTCDLSAYNRWKNQQYFGVLSTDSSFWIYQTQPQIVLTNGLALDLSHTFCNRLFLSLYYYRAGRMGPINIQDSYKIMCRPYCLEMDNLHQEAMATSGCSCLELSTQPDDPSYTAPGDWCTQNSARMLCDIVGYCGNWDCRIEDYMCPRYEWNKKMIPYKGPGNCIRGSASRRWSLLSSPSCLSLSLSLSVALLTFLCLSL